MDFYDTMFCRRSVRRFSGEPLPERTLAAVRRQILSLEQMEGQYAEIRIISQKEMGVGPAPHALVASCPDSPEAYANVGYVLEQMDLYFQSVGLGSLWVGMKLPAKARKDDCIVMVFGNTPVPMRTEKDFDRLPVEKIADTDNAITRAVRLAPSAVNSQPWQISCLPGKMLIRDQGRGLLRPMLVGKLNKIDVGIAACFAKIALTHEGETVQRVLPVMRDGTLTVEIDYQTN